MLVINDIAWANVEVFNDTTNISKKKMTFFLQKGCNLSFIGDVISYFSYICRRKVLLINHV